jgi:hypothetical protein
MGKDEGNSLAPRDGEVGDRGHVFAAQGNARAQDGHVGSGDGEEGFVPRSSDPRRCPTVAEAQNQFRAHGHRTSDAGDDARQVG